MGILARKSNELPVDYQCGKQNKILATIGSLGLNKDSTSAWPIKNNTYILLMIIELC